MNDNSEEIRLFIVFFAPSCLPIWSLKARTIEDGDAEQLSGVTWLDEPAESDKGHDIAAITPARVIGFAPVNPSLENGSPEWKNFSTRSWISGVSVPAITGGSAGKFSWLDIGTGSVSQIPTSG